MLLLIYGIVFTNWLRTDGPTDRRTDRPSYRDAMTHLKSQKLQIRLEVVRTRT